LTLPTVPAIWQALITSPQGAGAVITIDCALITELDGAGVAMLAAFVRLQRTRGVTVTLAGVSHAHTDLLTTLGWEQLVQPARAPAADATRHDFRAWLPQTLSRLRETVVFVGRATAGIVDVMVHPSKHTVREIIHAVQLSGPGAVPVVCMIAFLTGFVVAFQSSTQLQDYGLQIKIADLVGFALFSELAPVMMSVVMAGRSGSAFAAEIGSMKLSEELDALEIMSLNPYRYLVAPKIIASLLAFPCLTILADIAGLLGGMLVGAAFLDLPAHVFLRAAFDNMTMGEFTMGLYKSVVFAVLVSGVGCLRGMQVGLGADSVGRATTSAAVSGIFLTILANALITMSGYLL